MAMLPTMPAMANPLARAVSPCEVAIEEMWDKFAIGTVYTKKPLSAPAHAANSAKNAYSGGCFARTAIKADRAKRRRDN
jgi:hypothetical protein